MLLSNFHNHLIEAGCDEAGRGCLAGPVFAAAVIFDANFEHELLNDSKKIKPSKRMELREIIIASALDYSIASMSPQEIDTYNIHKASYLSMHKALNNLKIIPEHLIIDGNKFIPYLDIPHTCIIQGDGKYLSIAAASILAKTERDLFMEKIAVEYPMYDWAQNKGYPTVKHRLAIEKYGPCEHHRKSFKVSSPQLNLF